MCACTDKGSLHFYMITGDNLLDERDDDGVSSSNESSSLTTTHNLNKFYGPSVSSQHFELSTGLSTILNSSSDQLKSSAAGTSNLKYANLNTLIKSLYLFTG